MDDGQDAGMISEVVKFIKLLRSIHRVDDF